MYRKYFWGCTSLMILAVFMAAPSLASAVSPVLTYKGVAVKPGTKIVAFNEGGIVMTTSMGSVTCTKAVVTGEVLKNSEGVIEGEVTSASVGGTGKEEKCVSTISDLTGGTITMKPTTFESLPECIMVGGTLGADTGTIRAGKCSEAVKRLSWVTDLTSHTGASLGECTYRSVPEKVSFTFLTNTTPIGGALETNSFEKTSGSLLCPATTSVDGAINLYTDTESESLSKEDSLTIS